jgi:hypothetical protein
MCHFEKAQFSSFAHFLIVSLILGELSFFELPVYSDYESFVRYIGFMGCKPSTSTSYMIWTVTTYLFP